MIPGLAAMGGGFSGSSSATSGPADGGNIDAGVQFGSLVTGTQTNGLSTNMILMAAAAVVVVLILFRRK